MGLKAFLKERQPSKPHVVEIGGKDTNFYKIRVTALLKAESVVATVSRAAVSFMDPNKGQYVKRSVSSEQESKSGNIITGSIEEPISPIHAKARIERRESAMNLAVTTLLSEENAEKLAALAADSMADDELTSADIMEMDAAMFFDVIKATVLANAPALAPLLDKAFMKMTAASPDAEPVEESQEGESEA